MVRAHRDFARCASESAHLATHDPGTGETLETTVNMAITSSDELKRNQKTALPNIVTTSFCVCGGRNADGGVPFHPYELYTRSCPELRQLLPPSCLRTKRRRGGGFKTSCGHEHDQCESSCKTVSMS